MATSAYEVADQLIDDTIDDGCRQIAERWEENKELVAQAIVNDRQRCANLAKFHGASEQLVSDIMEGRLVDLDDPQPYTW